MSDLSTKSYGGVMGQGKQAKPLKAVELKRFLHQVTLSRYPERDVVRTLLSFKAGLRAKEIALLQWSMVTDSTGEIADAINIPDRASKGRGGGRTVPMHEDLRVALSNLMAAQPERVKPDWPVIFSERAFGSGYSANSMAVWFHTRFAAAGLEGASSHSGRRTFITAAARKISEAGGSLRDVQELAGHASLATTQRYISGDAAAKRNVIKLI